MPNIAVDAGPLTALFERSDRYHEVAKSFFLDCRAVLVCNLPVIAEACYLLGGHRPSQREFLQWTERVLSVDHETIADLPRIVEIMAKYDDLPADFADASLVALCERLGIEQVASFDSDFNIYRTRSRKRLHNVLADR